jgi:tRNA_anti-like
MPRYDDDDDRPRRRRRLDEEEDDDARPRSRRRSHRDDDEDDYEDRPRRRKKKRPKQMSVLGVIGFGIGVLALIISIFMPCIASYSLIVSGIGIVVGFIALFVAQKSDGREGYGMPIAAMSVSAAAVLIAVLWLVVGKQFREGINKDWKEAEARYEQEEAAREKERAKAAGEVKAANPDGVIRVSAQQFYMAYGDDEDRFVRLYKNKVIEITGVFHELDLTGEEGYAVLLKGGPERFDAVHCQFAKDPETRARLTQLQPGQTVTIRGKCLGEGPALEACILVN